MIPAAIKVKCDGCGLTHNLSTPPTIGIVSGWMLRRVSAVPADHVPGLCPACVAKLDTLCAGCGQKKRRHTQELVGDALGPLRCPGLYAGTFTEVPV